MVLHIVRILIGLLFVLSGVMKVTNLAEFYSTIVRFQILPEQFTYFAMIAIPFLEIVCGVLLILGIAKKWVISVLVSLLGFFAVAKGINLFRGEQFNCGCFGPLHFFDSISIPSILFIFTLMVLLILVLKKEKVGLFRSGYQNRF